MLKAVLPVCTLIEDTLFQLFVHHPNLSVSIAFNHLSRGTVMAQATAISTDQLEALSRLLGEGSDGIKKMESFPAAGTDKLVSSLVCHLFMDGSDEIVETIVMTSLLTIKRSDPYVNAQGLRQIDVTMDRWSAKGFSTVLGRTLEQYLSEGERLQSEIVAEQSSSDFPAQVTFRARFDVAVGGQVVLQGVEGTAHGTGWMSVPPDGDDILTVNKDMRLGPVMLRSVVCDASRPID